MTAAEKAQRLQDMAEHPYSYNMSNGDAEIAAECAAHFRALVPDANGLLPCPMCGPTSEATASGTFRGDHTVFCAACGLRIGHYCFRREAAEAWNRRGGLRRLSNRRRASMCLATLIFWKRGLSCTATMLACGAVRGMGSNCATT